MTRWFFGYDALNDTRQFVELYAVNEDEMRFLKDRRFFYDHAFYFYVVFPADGNSFEEVEKVFRQSANSYRHSVSEQILNQLQINVN